MSAREAAYVLFFAGGVMSGLSHWSGPMLVLLGIIYHKRFVRSLTGEGR